MEPGNPGFLQVSPTLQATRSNLTRVHSGNCPKYMEYFVESDSKLVRELVNVPLSETASRFLGKKNFNTVVDLIDPAYPHVDVFALVPSNVMKELLFIDNLVNMNARSVLSLVMGRYDTNYDADALIEWLNDLRKKYPSIQTIIPLTDLSEWNISAEEMSCNYHNEFKIIGIRTEAWEREVPAWTQPILFHEGMGMCGLLVKEIDGIDQYLVQAKPEAGTGASLELAPTVSCWDFSNHYKDLHSIPFAEFFLDRGAMEFAVRHSEEGGRFDHFINDYCLRRIEFSLNELPENFRWVTFNELKAANIVPGAICSELRTLIALIGARI
jgi:oxidase EvaA